jgi:hypothetical protein
MLNQGLDKITQRDVTLSLSKGVRWLTHILRQAQYDCACDVSLSLSKTMGGSTYMLSLKRLSNKIIVL